MNIQSLLDIVKQSQPFEILNNIDVKLGNRRFELASCKQQNALTHIGEIKTDKSNRVRSFYKKINKRVVVTKKLRVES